MQRHRQIAAAPERSAPESWATLAELIEVSVGRSEEIASGDISRSLETARPIGTMLIAAGHLDRHPITVVAGDLHLSLTTVSGDSALTLQENLNPVMGATKAASWRVYLPTPDPLGDAVRAATKGDANLSADDPPGEAAKAEAGAPLIDTAALRAASE